MRSLVVSLWLAVGLSSGFAQETIDAFVRDLEKVIQSAGADDLRKVAFSVPGNAETLKIIFVSKGASLVSYELISPDEAKAKWPTLVPKVIDSLGGVEEGELVLRLSWSKQGVGGEITIKQIFVVSKKEGVFKARLEPRK